jgi:uncharacterized membrane-anchored protein
VDSFAEAIVPLVVLLVGGAAVFLLVSLIDALRPSSLRPGWARTVAVTMISAVQFGLGVFTAVLEPRHGSEVVGVPLLISSALGVIALVLRLRRHFT